MTQKIIQIGSSVGVTMPKKQFEQMGLRVGDEVEVEFKPVNPKLKKFSEELDKFMDTYENDLKNLAKR